MHLLLLLSSRLGILALEEVGNITEMGISIFVVATYKKIAMILILLSMYVSHVFYKVNL